MYKTRYISSLILLVISLVFTTVTMANVSAQSVDNVEPTKMPQIIVETEVNGSLPSGVIYQDAEEALAADIALTAEQRNLPTNRVEQAIKFQRLFSDYADQLIAKYSFQISAIYVEPIPKTIGHIRFVADIPQEVVNDLESWDGLNPSNVVLTGNGRISIDDQYKRAVLAMEALVEAGYQNAVTFFDHVSNTIHIELYIPDEDMHPNKSTVVNLVNDFLAANSDEYQLHGESSMVKSDDIRLTIFAEEFHFEFLSSRGGNWLQNSSFNDYCTSGWSVNGAGGDGIVTAAHCDYLGYLDYLPEDDSIVHGMTFQDREFDLDGDVSWYTTTGIELAEFYSDSTQVRDVNSVKSTNSMVGQSVCVYGRASNYRDCSHQVEAVNVTFTAGGATTGNHARTDKVTNTFGDSGGGFSFGNTAWGVLSGAADGKTYFTTAEETESVLNITIKTQ